MSARVGVMDQHQKVLELAEANQLPAVIDVRSEVSVSVFRELYDAGYVDAIEASSMDGREYLEPRITLAGRQFLEELRAKSTLTNATNRGLERMKVFYSWQSDTPNKVGRTFIREALDAAVAGLHVDDADRPAVDQDTQGVLGSPPIADTILQKIGGANVVIADVTLTGSTPDGKRLANSNVCIELGYALGTHGHTVLLKVMNTHYGPPSALPFDLGHRRWPVQYHLAPEAQTEVRDAQFRKLVKTLGGILQQYIDANSQPSPPEEPRFIPTPSTMNPAAYWRDGDPLVPELKLGYRADQPLMYLRIWPRNQISPLSAALMSDYNVSSIEPLTGRGMGWSNARNRYGMMTYAGNEKSGSLLSTTQVFKTGEVWGVDENLLRKMRGEDDKHPLYVPTQAYEEGLRRSLHRYLKVARESFGYPQLIMVEAGLVNVEGYMLAMPFERVYERFWGPLYENVKTATMIDSENAKSIEAALLTIYAALYEAAGHPRPDDLYDFPKR